jgi:hypothetical protein
MSDFFLFTAVVINHAAYSYLTSFHHAGLHPYPRGFSSSSSISTLLRTVALVWLFGGISGIILAALALFDIINFSFFWVFMIPAAMSIRKFGEASKIHPFAAWVWQVSIIAIPVLLVICFFTQPFASLENYLHSFWQWGVLLGAMAIGFLCKVLFARIYASRL